MALLTSLLTRRQVVPREDNLDKGRIWTFAPSTQVALTCGFYWPSPGCGTALIEVWGSGGSGARMCCCGGGIPGNPGAYAKKTICVYTNTYICGQTGLSCANNDTGDFYIRGRGNPSGLCWIGACDCCGNSNGCMCAEGGIGGTSLCNTAAYTPYCCFLSIGLCGSRLPSHGDGCGIICNYGNAGGPCAQDRTPAYGYGGDVNCIGCFSCTNFMHCDALYFTACYSQMHIWAPAGTISEDPATIHYKHGNQTDGSANWSGQGLNSYLYAIQAASRNPIWGGNTYECWSNAVLCGCYESNGCLPFVPYGFAGPTHSSCADVRSGGYRGGLGAVRIKFICCDSCFFQQ